MVTKLNGWLRNPRGDEGLGLELLGLVLSARFLGIWYGAAWITASWEESPRYQPIIEHSEGLSYTVRFQDCWPTEKRGKVNSRVGSAGSRKHGNLGEEIIDPDTNAVLKNCCLVNK